jgi:hypothetical protein
MLAGQVLCPLSHAAPALFALVILEMGVSLFAQDRLDHDPPI